VSYTIKALLERVILFARANIGYGETEANNRGPFIDAIGGNKLTLKDPQWCALYAGYCYRKAYAALTPAPAPPAWLFRRPGVPEPGALRLVTGLASVGGDFGDPTKAVPGDLVLWKRTGGHHVGVVESVEDDIIRTIEGNVGRFPAKVKRLMHDVGREPHFKYFATLRTAL
jgi:hypothetical protein